MENVSLSLRGELTRWMLELKPGIFTGTLSSRVRDRLWEKIYEKRKNGSAFLIYPMNNEQKFEIRSIGNSRKELVNFDGLTLVRTLNKEEHDSIFTNKKKSKKKSTKKNANQIDDVEAVLSEFEYKDLPHDVCNQQFKPIQVILRKFNDMLIKNLDFTELSNCLPRNFIERLIFTNSIKYPNNKINFTFKAQSSFDQIKDDTLWDEQYTSDIKIMGEILLNYVRIHSNDEQYRLDKLFGKLIVSIDIETTDLIPKAMEGFVNIIGLSILDLRLNPDKRFHLIIHQSFNMTRKKDLAPMLLLLMHRFIENADRVIVFNQDFDIKILSKIITDYNLSMSFPKIIDLMKFYPKLDVLECQLEKEIGFRRMTTKKGMYSEYYQKFKGINIRGGDKMIEPIGTYNLMDSLTPLLMYILHFQQYDKEI